MFGSNFDEEEGDEKTNLSVIKDLMEQLVSEMKPSEDDFASRLGRKKHDHELEVVKVGVGMHDPKDKKEFLEQKDDLKGELEPEEMAMDMDEGVMSPGQDLKKRLMKLRA